jgi:hypothetical protein
MEVGDVQDANFKRKFADLVCFCSCNYTHTKVDESARVENELSQLKKQKLEWAAEREYIIDRLAVATQVLEQYNAEEKKSASHVSCIDQLEILLIA